MPVVYPGGATTEPWLQPQAHGVLLTSPGHAAQPAAGVSVSHSSLGLPSHSLQEGHCLGLKCPGNGEQGGWVYPEEMLGIFQGISRLVPGTSFLFLAVQVGTHLVCHI